MDIEPSFVRRHRIYSLIIISIGTKQGKVDIKLRKKARKKEEEKIEKRGRERETDTGTKRGRQRERQTEIRHLE